MNAPLLFPSRDAVATAAANVDILRRLADKRLPAPETIQALADELGHPDRSNFVKRLKQLERDGLVARDDPGAPTGLRLTPAGERAALAVGMATGGLELDTSALVLPHDMVVPNPLNPRKIITPLEIEEMADSIEANLEHGGVLNPLLVYPPREDGKYMLHAGEKRWRGLGRLIERGGVHADFCVPCRVRQPDDMAAAAQTAFVALTENGVRSGLSLIEEARSYAILIEQTGWSTAEAARRTGRDPRTVQEMVKVVREASPEAIAAHERGELKWEYLRDSVKKLSLTPQEALIVIELAHRQAHEDPALPDDAGGPPWVCVSLVPTGATANSLTTRGLLEFRHLDGDVLARVRTDNAKLDQFLAEAGFHTEPRAACLYAARAAVVGSFEARTLEQTGELATEWARFPEIEPVREEDGYAPAQLGSAEPAASEAFNHQEHQGHQGQTAAAEPSEGPRASRPHEEPRASGAHQNFEGTPAVPPLRDLGDLGDLGGSKAPEPRQPTPQELLALAEIVHKTAFNPVRVTPAIGDPVDAAEVDTIVRPEVFVLEHLGWIDTFGGDLVEAKSQFAVRLSDEGGSVLERHGADFADIRPMVDQARKDAGLSLARRAELTQSRGYATAFLNTDAPARPALTPDLPTLKPAAALALVELAARIAREGVEISGKPWRMVEVWDYHRDAAAGEITHARLAGWASHKAAWYGYITERGHAFLRAKGVDPDMISEADLASYREIAGVARQEAGWSTPFLNPKIAPDTGPARTAGVVPASPQASAARTPTALDGAVEILTSLADEAEWASQELAAISAKIASKDAEKSYALIQRIDAVQAEVAKARHFVQVARGGAAS